MNAKELIEGAMRGVRIIVCRSCNGLGEVLSGTCGECGGCGETTANELELRHDQSR